MNISHIIWGMFMTDENDKAVQLANIKLSAARLLLGEDLLNRLVSDDWNTTNSLQDPYDIPGDLLETHSASSVAFANEIVTAICYSISGEIHAWSQKANAQIKVREAELERPLTIDEAGAVRNAMPQAKVNILPIDQVIESYTADVDRLIAINEEKFDDAKLVSFQNGQFDFSGSAVPILAETLAQMLMAGKDKGEDPSDYAEISIEHAKLGELTMTLQRQKGMTPHQLRVKAEAQVADLTAKVTALEERIDHCS